jgi:hypothetical protein
MAFAGEDINQRDKSKKINFFLVVGVAALCAIFLTIQFNPGFMSDDSLTQYRQVIGAQSLNDAHPVVMVYWWRTLLDVFGFPGVMLAFHQLMYWSALVLLVVQITPVLYRRLLLLVMMGFWPPMLMMSLHIWKDVGMMSALALCAAAVLAYARKPHWGWFLMALLALFYAVAVRINGFIPGIILLLCLCYFLARQYRLSSWRTAGITILLSLGIALGQWSIMGMINAGVQRIYGMGTLLVWDMAAISVAENQNLLPPYLPEKIPGTDVLTGLQEKYTPLVNTPIYEVVSPYLDEQYHAQLRKDWLTLVVTHPQDYLAHRFHVFTALLGLTDGAVYSAYQPGIRKNWLGVQFVSLSQEDLKRDLALFATLAASPVYRVWSYVLLGLGVFLVASFRLVRRWGTLRGNLLAATVSLSGLVNAASLFFIATAADFRYMIWSIFSAIIAMVILLADLRNKRNA